MAIRKEHRMIEPPQSERGKVFEGDNFLKEIDYNRDYAVGLIFNNLRDPYEELSRRKSFVSTNDLFNVVSTA